MDNETLELVLPLAAFLIAAILRLGRSTRRYLWPLNLFAVFIHELCHGLVALATGGQFSHFIMERDGGVAYTIGGRRFFVIPAGYVGTALFGAVLLYLTNTVDSPGTIAVVLGLGFMLLTLLFSGMSLRKLNIVELLITIIVMGAAAFLFLGAGSDAVRWLGIGIGVIGILLFVKFISDEYFFTVAVGALSGGILMVVGAFGVQGDHHEVARFLLNFLAFMVGLNAIYDSWYLLSLIRDPQLSQRGNDATNMSREIGLPARFWALVWSLNAVVMLATGLWLAVA